MTSLGTDRRTLLRGSAAVTAFLPASVLVDARPSAAAPPPRTNPFTLGVASGEPAPDGFVIWTRLAPDPVAEDGLGGMPERDLPVLWEVSEDERFRGRPRRGVVRAAASSAHSVHVEVRGLRPGREHFYRFRVGGGSRPWAGR
jgi:alkaline phosphatase D